MEDKMSILQELQAQRTDAVSKLKRIEEKKSTVSIEVYEKVKKEYAEKLRGIEEQLSGHIDLITEEIQRLNTGGKERVQSLILFSRIMLSKFRLKQLNPTLMKHHV